MDGVTDGQEALLYAETEEYDGLVLDIMMPGMDGVEVLKRLRGQGISTPALFLTARTEIYQRVEGLDAGADDYLPKPFATAELLARVRAMLRRKDHFTPDLLSVGGLTLNRSTYELGYQGISQSLSGREFQIVEMLLQRPGFVVTTDEFLSHVSAWYGYTSPTSVKSWPSCRLRRKSAFCGERAMCWRSGNDLPPAEKIHQDLHPVLSGSVCGAVFQHLCHHLLPNHPLSG